MTGVSRRRSTSLDDELLTARDIAAIGVPVRTQALLRERGEFAPITRIGGRLYVRRELFEQWLDNNTDPQPTTSQSGTEVVTT